MADKLPAFQFYPGDWRKAPEVQACSFAARGLWVELLCLMFESQRRGYLELNGRPVAPEQIARMTGGTPDEVRALLAELEAAGVFSRDERGVIYSRRMDREQHIRNVRSEAGKKGAAHGIKGGRPRKHDGGESGKPNNPPLTAKGDLAVSPEPGISRAENGKNDKPNGKKTPSSSSSSSSEEGEAASAAPPTRAKKPRAECPLFEALADAAGSDRVKDGGYLAKVRNALAGADRPFTADDVREFARRWRELLPWAKPTEHPRLTLGIIQKHIQTVRVAGPPSGETVRRMTAADVFAMDEAESGKIYAPMNPTR